MTDTVLKDFLDSARAEFQRYKRLGSKSIDVLNDDELNADPYGANSVAVIVKHLHGNMHSRWTNIFTEDGEKPDRNRDAEFESAPLSKAQVIELYDKGWSFLESALTALSESDFSRPVVIRKEPLTLVQAIERQLTHYAYHVGQIVFIAKQLKGNEWISLSIPKGKSSEHTHGMYREKL